MTKAAVFLHLVPRFYLIASIGLLSIIIIVLTLGEFILQPSFSEIISFGDNGTARSNCNCVVFRIDDIQDYWIKSGQLAAMDQFISRNQSATLGIIMRDIGNDSEIINKVKQGKDSGLFELAVHGWNHTEYTKLSEQDQKNSLYDANRKMSSLFGNASEIFIPPYNAFDEQTINAMKQVDDMKILNANESSFDELELNGYSDESPTLSAIPTQSKKIFYLPATISFKDYYGGEYIRNSVQDIFNNVTENINAYGFAVIIIHPQDFMQIDANGNLTDVLDENQIRDLFGLIDLILSRNIHLGSFAEITAKIESKGNSTMLTSNLTSHSVILDQLGAASSTSLTHNSNSTTIKNCSSGWEVKGRFSPLESDYDEKGFNQTVTIYSLDNTNTTTKTLNSEFLKVVQAEGWGQTKQGDYIGAWDGKFWGPSFAGLTHQGYRLIAGMSAATDTYMIPYASNFTIPTLPAPWNTTVFIAVDIGSNIIGKQIGIYTGVGSIAEKEAARITEAEKNTVCVSLARYPLGYISAVGEPDSTITTTSISIGHPVYDQFDSYITNSTNRHDILDKMMVKSVIMQESHFDMFLVSPDIPCGVPSGWTDQESRSFGLIQVTPACGEVNGSRPNLTKESNSPNWGTSLFNPEYNIEQGVKSLSENLSLMKNKFPGCNGKHYMLMALGAYNSGEDAIYGCGLWNDRADEYITEVTKHHRIMSQIANVMHTD
jgi:3D (Asp-Asp-Asp) domain-containing protein/peptidoglycan/xylan/chitin deacetylase (PgdA/CDA1 family)